MAREDIAFKLVELYVTQIADQQEKRKMGLDTVVNAYFYTLLRLTRKEKEIEAFDKAVTAEEQFLTTKEEPPKLEPTKVEPKKAAPEEADDMPPPPEPEEEAEGEEFAFD